MIVIFPLSILSRVILVVLEYDCNEGRNQILTILTSQLDPYFLLHFFYKISGAYLEYEMSVLDCEPMKVIAEVVNL